MKNHIATVHQACTLAEQALNLVALESSLPLEAVIAAMNWADEPIESNRLATKSLAWAARAVARDELLDPQSQQAAWTAVWAAECAIRPTNVVDYCMERVLVHANATN